MVTFVLLIQLETPLNFDLLHAAILSFPFNIISRLKKSLERVESLNARILHSVL